MVATPRRLEPGTAHLWYAFTDAIAEPAQLDSYRRLLSPDEKARLERLLSRQAQHEFLLTRALVRCALSQYAPVSPEAWTFAAGPNGKPRVDGPHSPPVAFNLTNTRGLVACLVSSEPEVGVDTEHQQSCDGKMAIAEQFFSDPEVRQLRSLPAAEQALRFLELWTLKEAYIKARGLGLSVPLDGFSFELEGEAPRIRFHGLDDAPEGWRFALLRPGPDHVLATAIRSRGPVQVQAIPCVPLREPGTTA